jgi:predicted transposase YbfD/YdcC
MGGEIIPIDGETIRGSYDRNQGKSALHFISAWSSEQRLVLAQMKVEDKSNEIRAIPALLELLDIAGAIITIDAMGTQTEIAKKIIDKKADYVLALKANHRIALNALNCEQSYKRSLRQKMKRIAMDNNYMIRVLSCCFINNTLDSSNSLCQA